MAKTPEELEILKNQWLNDPSWDLEDTPGFEEHFLELQAFRAKEEAQLNEQYKAKCLRRAELAGAPGNLPLGALLVRFEQSSAVRTTNAARLLEGCLRRAGLDPDSEEVQNMMQDLVQAATDSAKAAMITELAREL